MYNRFSGVASSHGDNFEVPNGTACAPVEDCKFYVNLHYPKDYVSFLGTQMGTFIDPHLCGISNRIALFYRTDPLSSMSYAGPITVRYPIGQSSDYLDLETAIMSPATPYPTPTLVYTITESTSGTTLNSQVGTPV